MRTFFYLIFYLLCIGCVNDKEQFPQEDKAVKEVLDVFGGNCEYSIEETLSSKTRSQVFVLNISESNFVDEYQRVIRLPASGVAYTFYKNYPKIPYTAIRVNLLVNSKEQYQFDFPVNELKLIEPKMEVLQSIVYAIKTKEYSLLHNYIGDSLTLQVNVGKLIKEIKDKENELDSIMEFIPLGFRYGKIDSNEIVHVTGIMDRAKSRNYISAEFSLNKPSHKAALISYDY